MASDWFRCTTWSAEAESEFFAKLSRARKTSRAQYLYLQALTLASPEANEPQLRSALRLLEIMFQQYPQRSFLAVAHEIEGRCCELLKDTDAAIAAYLKSIDIQREGPGIIGGAAYALVPLCIHKKRWDLLEQTVVSLATGRARPTLLYQRYVYNAACAALAFRNRDPKARDFALAALEAAAAHHSGISHHPTVGLVTTRNAILDEQLEMVLRH